MNTYMSMTIKAAIGYLEAFEQAMKVAAMKDDAVTSKQEEKVLKKLNKITDKYIDELKTSLIDRDTFLADNTSACSKWLSAVQ